MLHLKSIDLQSEGQSPSAVVAIHYEGGSYSLPMQQVEAGQTFEIDIKRLRDEQIKDSFGNVIPMEVTSGQVEWYGRGPVGEFVGRLVQYDPTAGVSSSFSCPRPCECPPTYLSGLITPNAIKGVPGDVFFVAVIETDKDCNNVQRSYAVTNAFVTSSNPAVAQADGPNFDGTWTVLLRSNDGTATIRATWTAPRNREDCIGPPAFPCSEVRCTSSFVTGSAQASAQTQVPKRFVATSVTTANLNCSAGSGFGAKVEYQVADQNGNPIRRSGMTPQELITVTDDAGNTITADNVYRPFSTPQQTRNDGTFTDIPVGSCFNPPPPTNACVNATQLFRLIVPTSGGSTTAYDISTITFHRDCLQGIRVQVQHTASNVQIFSLGTVN